MAPSKDTPTVADTVDDDAGRDPGPAEHGLYFLCCPDPDMCGVVRTLARQTTTLGRNPPNPGDIELADPVVSKVHAEVTWSPVRERFLVGDMRSSNGTYLNGERIERELLEPGDIVRFGDTVVMFGAVPPGAKDWRSPDGSLLVGRSAALRHCLERVERAAGADVTVLIQGETGVGKELLAQTVHAQSGRSGPMRAINCAAIPKDLVESELFGHVKGAFSGADSARAGMFRAAERGTLFLDEVGELAQDVQAKLLRALESRRVRPVGAAAEVAVDVRVVAATNRDLEAAVKAGEFRADLYARLAEWVIPMAPLRDRPDDLYPLWRHFLGMHAGDVDYEMKGAVFEAMALHDWPYNVRELLRLVKNLALMKPEGGKLELADLPSTIRRPRAHTRPTDEPEDDAPPPAPPRGERPTPNELRALVEDFKGNIKEVATYLGKDRTQIYRWLKRYDIDPGDYR